MKVIEKIRKFFGNYFFRKEFSKLNRDVIVNNIESVSNAGILFFADSEETYRLVSNFVLQLKREGLKDVKMLGFVNEKTLPHYLNVKLGQDFLTKKDLNWYLKPVSNSAMNFIYEPFDILIDLTATTVFPLKYVLGLSRAHFKTGMGNDEKKSLLDLMINTNGNEEYLAKHILHYLKQINKVDGDVLAMLK